MEEVLLRIMEKVYKIWAYHIHRANGTLINLGGKSDVYGVYTVLDCIPVNACIVSAGLGTNTNFEEDVIKKYTDADVYSFDPTPKSIEYLKTRNLYKEERFHFFPCGISKTDGQEIFYLPADDTAVSCSTIKNMYSSKENIVVEMRSFQSVLGIIQVKRIDILKLDIEGTEFAIIEDILNSDVEIKQICLEIHPLYFSNPYEETKKFLKKMFAANYKIAYITRNGLGDELTFVKM